MYVWRIIKIWVQAVLNLNLISLRLALGAHGLRPLCLSFLIYELGVVMLSFTWPLERLNARIKYTVQSIAPGTRGRTLTPAHILPRPEEARGHQARGNNQLTKTEFQSLAKCCEGTWADESPPRAQSWNTTMADKGQKNSAEPNIIYSIKSARPQISN